MQIRLNRKFKTLKVKLLEPRFCADNYKYNNAIQIQKVLYFYFIENSYSVFCEKYFLISCGLFLFIKYDSSI